MAKRSARPARLAAFALVILASSVEMAGAEQGAARLGPALRKLLGAAAPAPAPVPAAPEGGPGANYSSLPAGPVSTRANFVSILFGVGEDAVQEASGGCVWGNFCGGDCDGRKNSLEPLPAEDDGGLDQACFRHDVCLEEKSHLAASTECTFGGTPNCDCDRVLYNDAWDIYNANKKDCGLLDLSCWEEEWVVSAKNVALSQEYRLYCGSCNE